MPAVTFTNKLQNGDSTDRTGGYSTASWTPVANTLYLLTIYLTRQSGTAVNNDTPTGNGITWTLVRFQGNGSNRGISLWSGSNASPSAGATTFTTGGVNQIGASWTIVEGTNADLVNPIVQSVGGTGTATSGSITLAAFADAVNNAAFGSFGILLGSAPTAGGGFTGVGTQAQGTPNMGLLSEYVSGQDTSVDTASWGSSVTWNGIAAEVKAATTAALTGTITASTTEADIVAGGKTIILTITGDTWIAAGALSFDAQRQNIINGLTSAQSETLGWNLVPKALQGVAGVVRTSNTVVTITLDAQATYDITAPETITATIPGSALTLGQAVVASPTFTITQTGAAVATSSTLSMMGVG